MYEETHRNTRKNTPVCSFVLYSLNIFTKTSPFFLCNHTKCVKLSEYSVKSIDFLYSMSIIKVQLRNGKHPKERNKEK